MPPSFVFPLPLQFLGYRNVPAFPIQFEGLVETLSGLFERAQTADVVEQEMNNLFTIGGHTATAYEFLFGLTPAAARQAPLSDWRRRLSANPAAALTQLQSAAAGYSNLPTPAAESPLTQLSLDSAEQFTLGWTNYEDVAQNAQLLLPGFTAALTDPDVATDQFWPVLAEYGLPFNLLVLQKASAQNASALQSRFASAAGRRVDQLLEEGRLYFIDTTIFTTVSPAQLPDEVRFTPAAVTLLEQDAITKELRPFAIWIAGSGGAGAQSYVRGLASDSAWLYALVAAKTSIVVWGVWLGHVYQYHFIPAAMQMSLFNTVSAGHPLYELLVPQSDYVIPFDIILFLLFATLSPPTSIRSAKEIYDLYEIYGQDRSIFADDPLNTLAANGITKEDFSSAEPWDRFPMVRRFLQVWGLTKEYVDVFVDTTYPNNLAVALDQPLQAWVREMRNPFQGNIQGLPAVTTKAALKAVLTSLLYRINVHGFARVSTDGLAALTFVGNAPPTLQDTEIPHPSAEFDTKRLLEFLPKTGTIGTMVNFYYTFIYTTPYDSFVPAGGVAEDLPFPGGVADPRNQALIQARLRLLALQEDYAPGESPQQWPLNVEL